MEALFGTLNLDLAFLDGWPRIAIALASIHRLPMGFGCIAKGLAHTEPIRVSSSNPVALDIHERLDLPVALRTTF